MKLFLVFVALTFAPLIASAQDCSRVAATLNLTNATVTAATVMPAGSFTPPPEGTAAPRPITGLPTFCRVQLTLTPSADSDIKTEVWMPLTGWAHDSAWKAAPEIPMKLFGVFEWPRIGFIMALPAERKEYLHDVLGTMHEVGGYMLIALVILHLAGALKHQFIDGEPEFRRMWPR